MGTIEPIQTDTEPSRYQRGHHAKATEENRILVFVKAPVAGRVKTRLARHLGSETAAALYRCFTADVLETLGGTPYPVEICLHPPESERSVRQWLGPGFGYRAQRGQHLGEKMARAFAQTFADGCRRAILIGTDVPDLPGKLIDRAFHALDAAGAVIGPAADGGYYLIGFRRSRFLPEVFHNIPWSTDRVLARTLNHFAQNRRTVHQLARWQDIDTDADIAHFAAKYRRAPCPARHTAKYLAAIGRMDGPIEDSPQQATGNVLPDGSALQPSKEYCQSDLFRKPLQASPAERNAQKNARQPRGKPRGLRSQSGSLTRKGG